MPSTYNNAPRDVQNALTEFSQDFDKAFALGDVEQWADAFGHVLKSDSIRTTFPIPISAAGYKLRDGDDKLRRLYERSLSMSPVEWSDGVYERARLVAKADAFIGWSTEPQNMAAEAVRHPNVLVADVLAQNPLLDFYREEYPGGSTASTIRLFAATHPYNVLDSSLGTFDNDWAAGDTVQGLTVPSEVNEVLVKQCRQYFRSVKGPNGRPLGLRFRGFLLTAKYEEQALDALKRDVLLAKIADMAGTDYVGGVAMPNRYGSTEITVADELTGDLPSGSTGDEDTVYALASRASGVAPPPWVVQRESAPEEIRYDLDSELYKDSGLIGVKYVLNMVAAAALPHAIVRINFTP